MQYTSYKLRRQILADTSFDSDFFKVLTLTLVEYIDWNTGRKKFQSKSHYQNWLKSIAEANGVRVEPEDAAIGMEPWKWLDTAVAFLEFEGYATMDKSTRTLQLMQKPDWDDETAVDNE